MAPKCIGKPVNKGKYYIHPLYFVYKVVDNDNDDYHECPTSIYFKDNKLKIEKKASKNESYDLSNASFDIKAYLSLVYNITSLDEAVEWTKNNINEDIAYIERMWDLVWDGIFNKDQLDDDILMNKVVSLFTNLYKANYSLVDKSLKKVLSSYSELSFHSKKSYQKILKKYINSNI